MFLNEALIRDLEAGLQYCVVTGGSRVNLAKIYDAYIERLEEQPKPRPLWTGFRVDDNALDKIKGYFKKTGRHCQR